MTACLLATRLSPDIAGTATRTDGSTCFLECFDTRERLLSLEASRTSLSKLNAHVNEYALANLDMMEVKDCSFRESWVNEHI